MDFRVLYISSHGRHVTNRIQDQRRQWRARESAQARMNLRITYRKKPEHAHQTDPQ